MNPQLLLVAKAPVAGHAKTRLGAGVGMDVAAELAAAALLDTIAAAHVAFPGACHLALAGDLSSAVRGNEILASLSGWHVFAQIGDGFGDRLAHAHRVVADHADEPVVQIGMDTPQVTADLLRTSAAGLENNADAVLGPAEDGGWWLLALRDGRQASVLADVPMSHPDTCAETVGALVRHGCRVGATVTLRDVDELDDAEAVAAAAPDTAFAQVWRRAGRASTKAAS